MHRRLAPVARKLARTAGLASGLLAIVLSAGAARAQEGGAAPPRPFNLHDVSGAGYAGVETMYGSFDFNFGVGVAEYRILTTDLVGEFKAHDSLKVFGRLPIVYFDREFATAVGSAEADGWGLGNATVGGTFLFGGGGPTAVGLSISASIPTSDDDGDEEEAAQAGSVLHSLRDPGRYMPDHTTVRFAGTFQYVAGNAFFGAELGVHTFYLQDDADFRLAGNDDQYNLVKVAVGGGALLGPGFAVIAELVSFSDVLEDRDDDEDWSSALEIGGRFDGGTSSFGAHFFFPLDDRYRDDLEMLGFGVDLLAKF